MHLLNEASVIIVTYNHQNFIENCLKTLSKCKELEVVVVDNNSTDNTVKLIEKNFPKVKLIKNPNNGGFSVGINLGMQNVQRKYVIILNPDTKVKENAIEELLIPLEKDKLITTPKVLYYDGSKINTCGNLKHFTGLSFTRGLGEDPKSFSDYEFVNGISGACFAMKRKDYLEIGGLNENFFLYMEDTEFSWRAHAGGLKILYVPKSIIYHDYNLEVNPEKIYYLEKGRYLILRQYLSWIELIRILPSLFMSELLTWGFSIFNGRKGIKFKFKALIDGLRHEVVKVEGLNGKIPDSLDLKIPEDQLCVNFSDKIMKKMANKIYMVNYSFFK